MADLTNDLRLAVDTGKVSLGYREVIRAVNTNSAKAVIVAEKGKRNIVDDINHICKVAGIRIISYKGSSMDLGTLCGKPYSVNSLAVIDSGNSNILNEQY